MERRKLDLPDRRHNTYSALEEKLDEQLNKHVVSIENRLHRFFKKALFIFAVIGITSSGSLLGFGLVLKQVTKTRKDFVRDTCIAQNQRHDETVAKFKKLAADAIDMYPDREAEIRRSIKGNLEIIKSLAPKQDCEKLSRVSVGEAKPPPPISKTP